MRGISESASVRPALAPVRLADFGKAKAEIILTSDQSDSLRDFFRMLTQRT